MSNKRNRKPKGKVQQSNKPPRRKQSIEELKAQCDEQINFLLDSCYAFDRNNTTEAKRLATTIRVLVHDTPKSMSLFQQLGLKTTFYDSSRNSPDITTPRKLVLAQVSLVGRLAGNPVHHYRPHLGDPEEGKMIDFENWWKQIVIIDREGQAFSRKDIVLTMSNQDGGAHVDPELDEAYHKLTRLNSVQDGFVNVARQDDESELDFLNRLIQATPSPPPISPAFYTVRQIAHEVLVSRLEAKSSNFPTIYPYDENRYSGLSTSFLAVYEEEKSESEGTIFAAGSGSISLDSYPDEVQAEIKKLFGNS